jgi:hypothetical protein
MTHGSDHASSRMVLLILRTCSSFVTSRNVLRLWHGELLPGPSLPQPCMGSRRSDPASFERVGIGRRFLLFGLRSYCGCCGAARHMHSAPAGSRTRDVGDPDGWRGGIIMVNRPDTGDERGAPDRLCATCGHTADEHSVREFELPGITARETFCLGCDAACDLVPHPEQAPVRS